MDETMSHSWSFSHATGSWVHRPWWKVAINTALRSLQRGRPSMLLVYTKAHLPCTPDDPARQPTAIGYGIGWIPRRTT